MPVRSFRRRDGVCVCANLLSGTPRRRLDDDVDAGVSLGSVFRPPNADEFRVVLTPLADASSMCGSLRHLHLALALWHSDSLTLTLALITIKSFVVYNISSFRACALAVSGFVLFGPRFSQPKCVQAIQMF